MTKRKPEWLKIQLKGAERQLGVKKMLNRLSLHTVCEEANCPNKIECFGRKTATFMILGSICTRNCTFCNVTKGRPRDVDPLEPAHVLDAVKELGLKHVVITSVTRDDLPDGGAGHFAAVINELHKIKVTVEVLIPDFQGKVEALQLVVDARPQIINHNVETVPHLYPKVRPKADYLRSLKLLERVKEMNPQIFTKSGIMLGLGEKTQEVIGVMKDLRGVGCDILTIGQYLAPSNKHHPVVEYVHPEVFEEYGETASDFGFKHVVSGPLVRSSYHADAVKNKPFFE
ncbi:lipoyl synthase [Desulfofalx alkaliphila]|uniref:lipoyl synthase n=1 Tax=Desulfofalx alkaliphila TaxID=105483 RepID=UPI0004E13921|nr:lipoyl synthase [Desulfofalx alkaliphila]